MLDGYDLAGYLDGSIIIPHETITTNGVVAANPVFTQWKRQDKLIYSDLLGAISVSVQHIFSTTTTSAEIWSLLASTYAKPTRGHVKQIKQQLENWTKETKTMDEYVQGFTTRFNQLALLGKPIDHEDQIDFIIGGLPDEYKTLADQIEARDTAPSITEIHEKLINHEHKLQTPTAPVAVPITANAASYTRQGGNANRGNNRHTPRNNQTWQHQQSTLSPGPVRIKVLAVGIKVDTSIVACMDIALKNVLKSSLVVLSSTPPPCHGSHVLTLPAFPNTMRQTGSSTRRYPSLDIQLSQLVSSSTLHRR